MWILHIPVNHVTSGSSVLQNLQQINIKDYNIWHLFSFSENLTILSKKDTYIFFIKTYTM